MTTETTTTTATTIVLSFGIAPSDWLSRQQDTDGVEHFTVPCGDRVIAKVRVRIAPTRITDRASEAEAVQKAIRKVYHRGAFARWESPTDGAFKVWEGRNHIRRISGWVTYRIND